MKRALIWLRKWWKVLAAVAGVAGTWLVCYFRLRPGPFDRVPLDVARNKADDRIAIARAEAAVRVAVLRERWSERRQELQAALDEPDEVKRQSALIAAAAKIREGR